MNDQRKVLIIVSSYHDSLTSQMLDMVQRTFDSLGIDYMDIRVPGCFDIPPAVRYAIRSMEMKTTDTRFIGYVPLGVLSLADSADASFIAQTVLDNLNGLASQYSLALGNGVIVAKTLKDAGSFCQERAQHAAQTCAHMMDLKKKIGL